MHCHLRRATVHWFWALLSRRERESQSGVVLAAPACHPCTQQFIQRQWQRQILGARHYWHRQLEWAYLSTTSSSTSLKFWSYNVGCQRCFKPMFIHHRCLCCQYQCRSYLLMSTRRGISMATWKALVPPLRAAKKVKTEGLSGAK